MKSPAIAMALVGISLMAGCSRDTARLEELSRQIAAHEEVLRNLNRQAESERARLQSVDDERRKLAADQDAIHAHLDQVAEEIEALDREILAYKNDYRRSIQARAKGMSLPDMTVTGTSYKNVRVSAASDTHLTIIHETGSGRVALADAPRSVQDLFAYDPSLQVAAQPRQAGASMDYLGIAILQGKETAEKIAQEKEERKKRSQKRSRRPAPSRSQQAPATNFTGSYYAPIQQKKPGPVSTIR